MIYFELRYSKVYLFNMKGQLFTLWKRMHGKYIYMPVRTCFSINVYILFFQVVSVSYMANKTFDWQKQFLEVMLTLEITSSRELMSANWIHFDTNLPVITLATYFSLFSHSVFCVFAWDCFYFLARIWPHLFFLYDHNGPFQKHPDWGKDET